MIDLEKAVKHKAAEMKKVKKVNEKFKGFNVPEGWFISYEKGIQKKVYQKDGTESIINVSFIPIIITKRFVNLDDDSERLEILFYRDKKWKSITAARPVIFNKNSLINLGKTGLPVSSNSLCYGQIFEL